MQTLRNSQYCRSLFVIQEHYGKPKNVNGSTFSIGWLWHFYATILGIKCKYAAEEAINYICTEDNRYMRCLIRTIPLHIEYDQWLLLLRLNMSLERFYRVHKLVQTELKDRLRIIQNQWLYLYFVAWKYWEAEIYTRTRREIFSRSSTDCFAIESVSDCVLPVVSSVHNSYLLTLVIPNLG